VTRSINSAERLVNAPEPVQGLIRYSGRLVGAGGSMSHFSAGILVVAAVFAGAPAGAVSREKPWIVKSNGYTRELLDIELEHSPEQGSQEGVAKFDELTSNPTLADQLTERGELEAVVAKLKEAKEAETQEKVRQDLDILLKAFDLKFRQDDYSLSHEVPFLNASGIIFQGLRGLLDDQVSALRRPASVIRLRKYVGMEPGSTPFTDILKQRVMGQMAKEGVIYPSRSELETELGRNSSYVDGIGVLFAKYKLSGWEPAYGRLKQQLADYDEWVRTTILPKSRSDFRLTPEAYRLAFEGYGIDISPEQIAEQAHAAFVQYQTEMAPLAAQVAKVNGYASNDYRSVIRELKKKQIIGAAILPFYKRRLHEIEKIIVARNIVTLPSRPAIIRLATAAETAQQPAPHMSPPPFLHNTGQRGEFVLPLNIPSADGTAQDVYDDFNYDAVSWTLTAHEARPGHELQFDSMVENGVSLARALYAFNSTNAEGWGLYSEYLMEPFEPPAGRLLTLQLRLLRAARAFIDPELQAGKITTTRAYEILEQDVLLSHAFAKEEVERFTYRAPGQANSYFYGYTKLLALRKETEGLLGPRFVERKFHDFVLGQGLLPPDLLRRAVLEDFAHKK
jgi:hypothetical protein